MSSVSSDFLNALDKDFNSRDDFAAYIDRSYELGELSGEFNIIGSVNNLPGGKAAFLEELSSRFEVLGSTGDLYLIHKSVDQEPVYSYVYLDDHTPVFFTTANKTDQIPPTIERFLQKTYGIGRLMLSKREIDEVRKEIVADHENVIIPFFSARRSEDSVISARHRPDTERSIQYRGTDGLETYREMRLNYGVLPSIIVFEQANQFKFKIKADGTFVHKKGGIETLWNCLKKEITRVTEMKRCANTAEYQQADSSFFGENSFSVSTPWAIEVEGGITGEHLKSFQPQMRDDFWEFSVSEYTAFPELGSFEAELIDESTHERTTLKSKGNDIRVFPRELTDVDQSLRIYNFISDHFDADCKPKKVA